MKYYFESTDNYDSSSIVELTDYELKKLVKNYHHKEHIQLYIEVDMPKEIADKFDALWAERKVEEAAVQAAYQENQLKAAYDLIRQHEGKKNLL